MTQWIWKICFLGLFLVTGLPVFCEDATTPVYRGTMDDLSAAAAEIMVVKKSRPTVTVRGFLNFRTTVDNTVIIFTPGSDDKTQRPKPLRVSSLHTTSSAVISNNNENMKTENVASTQNTNLFKSQNSLHRTVKEPHYQKTFNNVIPSSTTFHPSRTQSSLSRSSSKSLTSTQSSRDFPSTSTKSTVTSALPHYPTGLVTILGGTLVGGGITTVYETSVIGTYIEGKYAQILQSTSLIISSVSSTSVQKKTQPSATPVAPQQTTRKPRFQFSRRVTASKSLKQSNHPSTGSIRHPVDNNKDSEANTHDDRFPTRLESSFRSPESFQHQSHRPTQSLDTVHTRTLAIRPRFWASRQSEKVEDTVFMRSLRRPSIRFQYVPRKRKTNTVRLNRFKVRLATRPEIYKTQKTFSLEDNSETLPNEDSFDPNSVVYELTTVTSEVTLHVGRRRSVRTLTITTQVPHTLEATELLSNDLFELTEDDDNLLTSFKPSLTVITRSYSTTQHTWRTFLVPVFDGESTISRTVTESYIIRKTITAYRTMPPADLLVVNASEFQFPDIIGLDSQSSVTVQTPLPGIRGSRNDNPLLSLESALSQNPLAAVYLGLQQLNQQVALMSTITKTSSYVTTETVYSTKVVSFYDGRATRFRTLSEVLSTIQRTLSSILTTVQPVVNTEALQQRQQFQQLFATQPQPQYTTITSSYTTVTTATSTKVRVYTLIYNAFSTKYRTVTSTSFIPTTVSTFTTIKMPVTPVYT
ncbi:uncharacterized protein LOC143243346 [Tachypleus tridentatus]|uniref:uncharacterized protein LOC143243346 n=1 Tax=Tachypleus tridentatus TaxID=6853 RepID=UPI003FD5ECED